MPPGDAEVMSTTQVKTDHQIRSAGSPAREMTDVHNGLVIVP